MEQEYTFTDKAGWIGKFNTDPKHTAGIILQNIMHNQYPFAKDIRVIGFFIEFENEADAKGVKTQYYPFESSHFISDNYTFFNHSEQLKNPQYQSTIYADGKNTQNKITNEILYSLHQFRVYSYVYGIKRIAVLKNKFAIDTDSDAVVDFEKVVIEQKYLFSKYGNDPSHEPSGGLEATRLFPLITFSFLNPQAKSKQEENKKYYKIKSIRADYRFEFNPLMFIKGDSFAKDKTFVIDKTVRDTSEKLLDQETLQKLLYYKPQQAGLFADNQDLNISGGASTFDAAEKPLLYEVVADGLVKDFQETDTSIIDAKPRYWDNIHWWGGYRQYHIVTAPGAFHAIHTHWRWSKFLQGNAPKQYSSSINGGVLLDPNIPQQDLQLAVVRKDISPIRYIEQDLPKLNIGFKDYFTSKLIIPEMLFNPDESDKESISRIQKNQIVLHFTCKAYRTKKHTQEFKGSYMIHGIFFAHNKEPKFINLKNFINNSISYYLGDADPDYESPSKEEIINNPQWKRNPKY